MRPSDLTNTFAEDTPQAEETHGAAHHLLNQEASSGITLQSVVGKGWAGGHWVLRPTGRVRHGRRTEEQTVEGQCSNSTEAHPTLSGAMEQEGKGHSGGPPNPRANGLITSLDL